MLEGVLNMKFFIDTADIEEINKVSDMGLIDGVTTNPSLVAKTGKDFKTVADEICAVVDGPISLEAVSLDAEGMVKEAGELSKINKNVVIKIPMTIEGLKAIKALSKEGIKTNCTLIFSPNQALMAAKAGATYVSPFLGRLDDIGHEGMQLVEQIKTIYDNYGFDTEIIVASIRSPMQVWQAAEIGAHIATIPFDVIEQMSKHPLTDIGMQKFLDDWKKVPKK